MASGEGAYLMLHGRRIRAAYHAAVRNYDNRMGRFLTHVMRPETASGWSRQETEQFTEWRLAWHIALKENEGLLIQQALTDKRRRKNERKRSGGRSRTN